MADQLSEEQQRILQDTAAQWQQQDKHTVLSQEEMNTLLSAYESANAPGRLRSSHKKERQVRLYDFAKPDRLSKEHLRILQAIHDSFAAELTAELTALSSAATKVYPISIDQVTYKQYRTAIPPKTLLADVPVGAMTTDIYLTVNSSIVGVWVDYLCGGNPNLPATPSSLTPLDIAVAKKVIEQVIPLYTKAWPGVESAPIRVERATEAEFSDETLDPSETVLVCNFEVQTGASVGMMTICIPAAAVERVMSAVSAAESGASRRQETSPETTAKALAPVGLDCHVVLGSATASLSDLANCEVGDVLRLNKRAGDEAEFWVGSRHVFNCRPGIHRGNVAVVISALADSDAAPGVMPVTGMPARQTEAQNFISVQDSKPELEEGEDDALPAAA